MAIILGYKQHASILNQEHSDSDNKLLFDTGQDKVCRQLQNTELEGKLAKKD